MTCIVGLVDNGKVYIGADSAGVSGYDIQLRKDPKVFKKGEFIFGFTSSFRMGQLLQYHLNIPTRIEGQTDDEYIQLGLVESIIRLLESKKYAKIENNVINGGVFLFGYRGNLYYMDVDFQVGKNLLPFDSCGCGEFYAKGAMSILLEINAGRPDMEKMSPKYMINKAIETACQFSVGVAKPIIVEVI